MPTNEAIVKRIRAGLEHERRINLHRHPLRVNVLDGAVLLEGEVDSIAAKKLALEIAAAAPQVRGIVDRLRVAVERRGDGAVRASLAEAMLRQQELRTCTIRVRAKGRVERLREVAHGDRAGDIEIAAEDGVVSLEGSVISLSHKRLAGVLAWWTPGCRDVVNSLEVAPAEEDNDAEVVEALRIVFEADPMIDAGRITAQCRNYVVTLQGLVRSVEEKRRAEFDAWALAGVDDVHNRIEVDPNA